MKYSAKLLVRSQIRKNHEIRWGTRLWPVVCRVKKRQTYIVIFQVFFKKWEVDGKLVWNWTQRLQTPPTPHRSSGESPGLILGNIQRHSGRTKSHWPLGAAGANRKGKSEWDEWCGFPLCGYSSWLCKTSKIKNFHFWEFWHPLRHR